MQLVEIRMRERLFDGESLLGLEHQKLVQQIAREGARVRVQLAEGNLGLARSANFAIDSLSADTVLKCKRFIAMYG